MGSRSHILFIPSWYPYREHSTHGIFNRLFVEAAARFNKVSVLFVTASAHLQKGFEVVTEEDQDTFTVRVYYPGSPHKRFFLSRFKQYYRRIKATQIAFDLIKEKQGLPQLVQLNVVLPAGPAALRLCRKYDLPLVVNEGWTGYAPEDGRYRGFITTYFTRKTVAAARYILPVTSYLKDLMLSHQLKGDYRVVPNVVDTDTFVPRLRPENQSVFRFIHVSALDDAQKNVSGILRAFSDALKEKKELELIIAGEGEDAALLSQLAVSLGIGAQVKFVGAVDPPKLSELFNGSNALVMFSNYETFCVVVPEALACGLPVITSDAGGIMSYLDKNLGLIVPRRDEAALSRALLDMANAKVSFDPPALRHFVLERFSKEVVSKQLAEIYTSVLIR